MEKISKILKTNKIFFFLYKSFFNVFFKFVGIFVKTEKNLILFNGLGYRYNDSPKAIFEKMIKDKDFQGYKFVWAVKEPSNVIIPNAKVIKMDSFKYFLTALKSKVWISCMNIERSLTFKKRKTFYLNTWHGIPIKTVGNNAKGRSDFNFKNVNCFCVSSEYETEIFKQAFKLKESQIFNFGLPRNDQLLNFDCSEIIDIKKKIGIKDNRKIILYAPTFREEGGNYSFSDFNIEDFTKLFSDKFVLLLRGHLLSKVNCKTDSDCIVDCSNYPDTADLLKITDLLITDYSSIVFDYSLLGKPFIMYAYDLPDYEKNRGLSLDYQKDFDGVISYNFNDTINLINLYNKSKLPNLSNKIVRKYLKFSGESTQKCIDLIKENLK